MNKRNWNIKEEWMISKREVSGIHSSIIQETKNPEAETAAAISVPGSNNIKGDTNVLN